MCVFGGFKAPRGSGVGEWWPRGLFLGFPGGGMQPWSWVGTWDLGRVCRMDAGWMDAGLTQLKSNN